MITIKLKQNFDLEKLIKNVNNSTSIMLNDVAQIIKEGWDEEINSGSFESLKTATTDLHGSHRPLKLTGKLAKSNKILPSTPDKLKAVVQNTAKSSKNYKVRKPNGKIHKGTRKSPAVFYGYYQNYGFKTASNSLIPNRTVPARDFTSKTIDNLGKNPKYIKANKKFAKNLNQSMKKASK